MKHNTLLTIASLISIVLLTFHLTDDIVRGMEPGTLQDLVAVPILAIWLYGALVLADRPSGYVIIFLGSLIGLLVPVIHMKGAGVGGAFARSSGAFFFIWTFTRSAWPRSSPPSSRRADCGNACRGGSPRSRHKVLAGEAWA